MLQRAGGDGLQGLRIELVVNHCFSRNVENLNFPAIVPISGVPGVVCAGRGDCVPDRPERKRISPSKPFLIGTDP